jgi:hypothetical protein
MRGPRHDRDFSEGPELELLASSAPARENPQCPASKQREHVSDLGSRRLVACPFSRNVCVMDGIALLVCSGALRPVLWAATLTLLGFTIR